MPPQIKIENEDGTERDPTGEEVSEMIEMGLISNEPGVGLFTRWMAKTFSTNPGEAKGFLERQGFSIQPVTDKGKMQFLIHSESLSGLIGEENNKPTLFDPQNFDKGDLVDIAFDVLVAAPVIALTTAGGAIIGAPGGPVGSGGMAMAGAGAGSAFVEAGRQEVGRAIGVNKKTDPEAVNRAGLIGAAALPVANTVAKALAGFTPALLRTGKHAFKKAAVMAKNVMGKVSGATEEEITAVSKDPTLLKRVVKEQSQESMVLLDKMRGTIATLRDKRSNIFPETREMNQILQRARPVPLKGLMEDLERGRILRAHGGLRGSVGEEKIGARNAKNIARDIAHGLGFADIEEAKAGTVSAQQALEIQDILQKQAFGGATGPKEKFVNKLLKDAQRKLGRRIEQSIPDPQARARYVKLNGYGSDTLPSGKHIQGRGVVGKMEAINELDKRLGEHKTTQTAESFLESVTKPGRTQDRRLVEQFDRLFGTHFLKEGIAGRMVKRFSGDAPRITAVGGVLGAAPGAAIGAKLGGPFGAAIGAPVGAVAGMMGATPKGAAIISRGIFKGEEAVDAFARAGGRGVHAVGKRVLPLTDYLAAHGVTPERAVMPAIPEMVRRTGEEESPPPR